MVCRRSIQCLRGMILGFRASMGTIQATGPLTQAMGPLRSDAGVGIGMLRGISLLPAKQCWMIPLIENTSG